MTTAALPDRDAMLAAFAARDPAFDGVFVTAVRTTGIFCRPTCPARRPRPENVEFFAAPRDALLAGYRPCLRCRPLAPTGQAPEWLAPLLEQVEADPSRRWTDGALRELGLSPGRVRRWFSAQHGMTFHAYSRARRLGAALGRIRHGESVTAAAFAQDYESLSAFHDAFRKLLETTPTAAKDARVVTVTRLPSPLGPLLAGATDDALYLLEFLDRRMLPTQLQRLHRRLKCLFVPGRNVLLDETASQLTAYFDGALRDFTLPLDAPGSPFQRAVWDALREIPYGTTTSYGALAARLGRPTACRAVARANGDNRLAIVIPCHRVVGADGTLTGYGGGLWRKQRLLEIEGVMLAAPRTRGAPGSG